MPRKIFSLVLLVAISCSSSCSRHSDFENNSFDTHKSYQQSNRYLASKFGFVQDNFVKSYFESVLSQLVVGKLENKFLWRIRVFRDDTPNAFYIGNGVITLSTGLIEKVKHEPVLFSVIAHEIAHAELGHFGRKSFSSEAEFDADSLATAILKRAGIDPIWSVLALDRFTSHLSAQHRQELRKRKEHLANNRFSLSTNHRNSRAFNKLQILITNRTSHFRTAG